MWSALKTVLPGKGTCCILKYYVDHPLVNVLLLLLLHWMAIGGDFLEL